VTTAQTYTISIASGDGRTYLNHSQGNITLEVGASIDINVSLNTGQFGGSFLNLTENGVQIAWNQTNNISIVRTYNSLGNFIINGSYSGNSNYTGDYELWNVTVKDTIRPILNLSYPLNTTYTSVQTRLNYSVSDLNLQACWYTLNGGVTNITITCGNNVTGLDSGQGTSIWIVYANDTSGNVGNSSVTFYVDSIVPTINITSPLNTSTSTSGSNSLNAVNISESIKTNSWIYYIQGSGFPTSNTSFSPLQIPVKVKVDRVPVVSTEEPVK